MDNTKNHDNASRYSSVFQITAGIVIVSFIFNIIAALYLIMTYTQMKSSAPLNNSSIETLVDQIKEDRNNELLKEKVRDLDLNIRSAFFLYRQKIQYGQEFLLWGSAVLLGGLAVLIRLRKKLPHPSKCKGEKGNQFLHSAISRRSIPFIGLLIIAASAALFFLFPDKLKKEFKGFEKEIKSDISLPNVEKPITPLYWPRFRGPGGLGVAASKTNFPVLWDTDTGQGIIWKTPVPLKGASSPVVWNDRVFLTGATAEKHEVYCFDTASGRLLWQKSLSSAPTAAGTQIWDESTHAAATPVTDGRRICAIFANGDLVCLDSMGNVLWSKYLGPLQNSYGHASSLDMYQGNLIVLLDQKKTDDGRWRSGILAFDVSSGRIVWETPRPTWDSWTSPIIINAAGHKQIITSSMPWVIAYDAGAGTEIWRVNCLKGDIAPSPIYAGGLVFAVMEGVGLTVIKPDGSGDVTATHVAWQVSDGDFPSICSPVSNGDLLFLVDSAGYMTCWDIAARAVVWEHDLEVSVVASPTLVGEHVYVTGEEGEGIVLKASAEYVEVARSKLNEFCQASPAFVAGRIYIRGEKHLFCIGKSETQP